MKDRADKILTDKNLVATRSQAKSLIEKGDVICNGVVLKKAGELIDPDDEIEIKSPLYVGRGAFKLERALEEFALDVDEKVFVDIGASTGGFTEILLMKGASKVYAIDVGHNQLAVKLRLNPHVVNMEGTNIRDVHELPELMDGAVMDLSFISITKVLENIQKILKPGGFLVALIKPQFEAGVERLPKDGVIKDDSMREMILNEVLKFAVENGWDLKRTIPSPIEGKSGNKEFLSYFIKR